VGEGIAEMEDETVVEGDEINGLFPRGQNVIGNWNISGLAPVEATNCFCCSISDNISICFCWRTSSCSWVGIRAWREAPAVVVVTEGRTQAGDICICAPVIEGDSFAMVKFPGVGVGVSCWEEFRPSEELVFKESLEE
jgi:hypothetical protein